MWKKKSKVVCFDVGGTHLRKAVIDFSLSEPAFLDFKKERLGRRAQIKEEFLEYVKMAEKKFKTKKVAVASAGIVNNEKKQVSRAAKYYGKEVFSFSFLEKAGFEVFLENDGRAFGWGSYVFELNKRPNPVLSLVLGTGIGGGLILNGEVFRGKNFSAMEISHLFWGNELGKKGVFEEWENFSAGRGIEKSFFFFSGGKRKERAEEVFALAKKGDKPAQEALEMASSYFSLGLANLINIFDPEMIVLGGLAAESQKKFFQQAVRNSCQFIFNQKIRPKIYFSQLNEKANLLGVGDLLNQKKRLF